MIESRNHEWQVWKPDGLGCNALVFFSSSFLSLSFYCSCATTLIAALDGLKCDDLSNLGMKSSLMEHSYFQKTVHTIILRRIASYRILSHRIVSQHIALYRILSHHHIASHLIALDRIALYHIVSHRIVSYCIASHSLPQIKSYHVVSSQEWKQKDIKLGILL